MRNPTFQLSNDGVHWRSPTSADYRDGFVGGVVGGLLLGPLASLLPLWVAQRTLRIGAKAPRPVALATAVGAGGVTGTALSIVLYAFLGGWGPPQLLAFTAAGVGVGLGWGLVATRRQNAEQSAAADRPRE